MHLGNGCKPVLLAIIGAVATLSFAPVTGAHETKLSSVRIAIEGSSANAVLELNGIDLDVATGRVITRTDERIDADALRAQAEVITAYVRDRVQLRPEGASACPIAVRGMRAVEDHVLIDVGWRCPPIGEPLVLRVTLFHEIDAAARHLVIVGGGERRFGMLGVMSPQMRLQAGPAGFAVVVWHYLLAGVEHIAIGFDHIAFLIAVIVPGRRFWSLVAVVTSFTVAHSITLSLAVLEVVSLPSAWVESAIAASIVYVAAENFFVRDIRYRWIVTFAFGLIHGFGFASMLRDYGLPQDALVPALAAFNFGVEAGQLLIVAVAVSLWRVGFAVAAVRGAGNREAVERRVALGISAAVLLLGLYWLVQRLVEIAH
ncbi:MAG: HupE/UreJ family protein [Burkholderiales bacterium]